MSTLLTLYSCLLIDVQRTFGVPIGSPECVSHEWVLVEAPKLDKAMLRYFEVGGEIPQFPEWLTPLWDKAQVEPEPYLRVLRTVLNFGYKAEYEPTAAQIEDAERQFLETEDGIEIWDRVNSDLSRDPFYRRVRVLIHKVLCGIKMDEYYESIPFHGPGAVYPPKEPWERSDFTTQYHSIDKFYPWDRWFHSIFIDDLCRPGPVDDACRDIVCSMVAVPKDSRGPRLICVHPAECIWVQQSQRTVVERAITRSPLTKGFINFEDQSINGNLAMLSSQTKEFFTLDLKEASDSLSDHLVRFLLESHADILSCSRATHVKLLSGRTVALRKWAPMGNCLTFPVESLIFWALSQTAIHTDAPNGADSVYVFGDDIIGPVSKFDVILKRLVRAGLKPNMNKTFKDGSFRESCGVDAYKGVNITPLRTKVRSCHTYSDAISLCSLARRAKVQGYIELSASIYGVVREFMKAKGKVLYQTNNPQAQGIVEIVDEDFYKFLSQCELQHKKPNGWMLCDSLVNELRTVRFNPHLHRWETRYYRLLTPKMELSTHSRWNVVDSLIRLARKGDGYFSDLPLEYAVPNRYRLQLGWIPIAR